MDCGVNQLLTGAINKICGVSSNDLYVVGNNGTIAHYNGSQWRKIESGTSSNINDIWGVMNDNTSLILGAVSNRFQVGDYKLLSLSSVAASDTLMWNFQRLYGLWFISKRSIYVVGDDIHIYKNNKWETLDITDFFLTRVKGTALNNIYISGCCNQLFHFNGKSWKAIEGIYGNYEGLDSKDDLIVAVGWAESNAVILRGRRTN